MQKNGQLGAAPHCLVAELRAPPQCTRDLKNGNTTRLPPKRTHPNRSATKRQSRKRPRVRRSGPKNAKSMRYNVPAYGTWVLSDYITAGKQPACFHYATLARTKAHTFGTFRHPNPNSTGCLDPEARHRPDHSDSIASGWPQRGNICPEATSPIGLLGCSRNSRIAVPSFESHLLLKRLIKGVDD